MRGIPPGHPWLAPLDPPATAEESSWWRAKRRKTIRNTIANSVAMVAVFGAGSLIGHHFNVYLFGAVLLLSGGLCFTLLRIVNREFDIRAKRAADDLAVRQAQFLALLRESVEPK